MKATNYMREAMQGTRPWILFFCISLFVFGMIGIVASLAIAITGALNSEGATAIAISIGLGVLLLGNCIMLMYPVTRLWGFASALGQFNQTGAVGALEHGLGQHRKFWQAWGVITIVIFVFNTVVGVIAALSGVLALSPPDL